MQPVDVILAQDHTQIVALLEYVRYDFQPQIQKCSIKIMSLLRHLLFFYSFAFFINFWDLVEFGQLSTYMLKDFVAYTKMFTLRICFLNENLILVGDSSRMIGLVQLLLKSSASSSLIEDYAACLELRSEECQIMENSGDDPGVLIMQVSPWRSCEGCPT